MSENVITQARQEVVDALTSLGVAVYPYIPASIDDEAITVLPGQPYVQPGQVMGEYKVTLSLRLFVRQTSENDVVSEALDALIVNVCAALRGYGVAAVERPGISNDYSTPYLVTDITIAFNY